VLKNFINFVAVENLNLHLAWINLLWRKNWLDLELIKTLLLSELIYLLKSHLRVTNFELVWGMENFIEFMFKNQSEESFHPNE
jgi:hypothetical protein